MRTAGHMSHVYKRTFQAQIQKVHFSPSRRGLLGVTTRTRYQGRQTPFNCIYYKLYGNWLIFKFSLKKYLRRINYFVQLSVHTIFETISKVSKRYFRIKSKTIYITLQIILQLF